MLLYQSSYKTLHIKISLIWNGFSGRQLRSELLFYKATQKWTLILLLRLVYFRNKKSFPNNLISMKKGPVGGNTVSYGIVFREGNSEVDSYFIIKTPIF